VRTKGVVGSEDIAVSDGSDFGDGAERGGFEKVVRGLLYRMTRFAVILVIASAPTGVPETPLFKRERPTNPRVSVTIRLGVASRVENIY
jgi:hypothetical protein